MSKQSDAKKARRRKRQAARDTRLVPHEMVDQLADIPEAVVADLAEFDDRITARGWTFDEEQSNDDYAVWFYEPSGAPVQDGLPVTSLWLDAAEDGEIVRVVFVGSVERYEFTHEELLDGALDVIEGYRHGAELPTFG
ncbi:hypothetical protein [Mycolicibacterium fortuitum]|uniref:Uncharacterized protein n=2 Tax=Mycolicibacterium fortuitum TaxID=1766 RepID=A0A0N7H7W9_MYCFO|nr:hypothetical protein [Mycolicibacterium fortuitum]AIY44850.1 hypothetical protein G155_03890 [Mycobacterium sp. VKM Ac-1817D]CRL79878.1 hypothetical protein CPGR_03074 [Mycolicibacter nonchromogenicus]ALI24591.1 hypothetical protein XA26_07310 [Mycolicibacterium fortuitum]EJZ13992.1 hypothetical protein MFORT_11696 [Mycolicibacterium fortuitum subsp. fortuitum DSM 46621 = ATCC 6841 = JCM 6387]MBP3085943.1 hypothetical protein [Mycolicibacterium fortuitum]